MFQTILKNGFPEMKMNVSILLFFGEKLLTSMIWNDTDASDKKWKITEPNLPPKKEKIPRTFKELLPSDRARKVKWREMTSHFVTLRRIS